MSEDPWKHRSDGMKCKTCMWFVAKVGTVEYEPLPPGTRIPPDVKVLPYPPVNIGRCRRHAPTMNGYPVVFVNDWCGDHKLDEEKM